MKKRDMTEDKRNAFWSNATHKIDPAELKILIRRLKPDFFAKEYELHIMTRTEFIKHRRAQIAFIIDNFKPDQYNTHTIGAILNYTPTSVWKQIQIIQNRRAKAAQRKAS